MTLRILTFDGSSSSGGSGFVAAALASAIRQHLDKSGDRRPWLAEVDVFAGTSLGAINALFLAAHADPDEAVHDLQALWAELLVAIRAGYSLGRGAAALAGRSAYVSPAPLHELLVRHFGANTRLRDLAHPVLVPAFMLDGRVETESAARGREAPSGLAIEPRARWMPHVFSNVGPRDLDERVVDVALRSAAAPLVHPIQQGVDRRGSGYVDGSLFACNPTLVAIGHALEQGHALDDLRVLSLGNAWVQSVVRPDFKDGVANWGFATWLLDPRDPMLLMSMVLEAGGAAIDQQARALLGDRYHRFDPFVVDSLAARDAGELRGVVEDLLGQRATEGGVREVARWLDLQEWRSSQRALGPAV